MYINYFGHLPQRPERIRTAKFCQNIRKKISKILGLNSV